MRRLLLHSHRTRLSWSSGGISAHMAGQANPGPGYRDSKDHQDHNKMHNTAFEHSLMDDILRLIFILESELSGGVKNVLLRHFYKSLSEVIILYI